MLLGFAATVALLTLALGWVPGAPAIGQTSLPLAVLCGLIAWLFAAVFHIRRETCRLPVGERATFAERLTRTLDALGYDVACADEGRFEARPRFWSLLAGGRVEARIEGGWARVNGPRVFVEMLRRRLRLDAHITQARRAVRDARARDGERLVKRVEMALRCTTAHWQAVHDEILRRLEREGAQIVCEVQLLATSENGLREQLLEEDIPERLKGSEIRLEIRKDFARWEEPPVEPGPEEFTPAAAP